ncbi:carbohydrate porin [Nitrospirillum viridazoti]|uniref:Carbohydrate porin n=1 Tax=Nitrospirillum viridazoti CBAmc TaxID=1441467 RepID=A0A248JYB5_9PROT|nr:carbohydrate porin [Nitrospirillum amazonense]ASG23516.1 carbohydrate porin [Nitrospirillum amazonense CBAmc]TWB30974.1 OprB family porin [Nitrospirillum amazonense]
MRHIAPSVPNPFLRPVVETFPVAVLAMMLSGAALAAEPGTGETIDWLASYTGEAAANPSGGMRQGAAYAGQILLGADVNLTNALDWSGSTLHVAAVNRHGSNLAAQYLGSTTSLQEIYGAQNTRLARFTVEQSLLDGRLVVEGGRTVANISFLGSALCANFQINSACGNPTFVFKTSSFTWWPVSSWGAHATAWLTPTVYLHVGAYEVNPSHQSSTEHGFDWGTATATGAIAPMALGYQTTFDNDRLPRKYEVGGWYDGADYTDPLRDASGRAAVVSGQPNATLNGRSGVFFRFEQMVLRPDDTSQRGLTLFGVAMTGTSGRLIEDHFLELGLVQRGTFAGRDDDTIGFVVNQQKYSHDALEALRLARAAAGGSGTPADDQIMMELSYGVQLARAVRIQPNLQYVIHPDQFSDPARLRDAPDAFVIGLRFDLDLAALLRGR